MAKGNLLAKDSDGGSRDARFRAFFDLSSEGIWRCDLDEPLVLEGVDEDTIIEQMFARSFVGECNDAMARMYGFDKGSELVGRRLSDMHDVADPHSIELHRAFIRANFRIDDVESLERDRHGVLKRFINSSVGIVENGKLISTWGTQRDVTAQRAAEQSLAKVFATAQDAMLIADDDRRYVDANPAACVLVGYTRDALLKMRVDDLGLLPPGTDLAALWRAFIDAGTQSGEITLRQKDGGQVRVEFNAAANIVPGRHLSVMRDVTERRRSSERLAGLYAVTAGLAEATTMAEVARVTMEQGVASMGASAGILFLMHEDRRELSLAGAIGYDTAQLERWMRVALSADVPIVDAVTRQQAVYLDGPEERVREYQVLSTFTAQAPTVRSVSLPLMADGRVLGALCLSFDSGNSFTAEEKQYFTSLARQCSQGLERARLLSAERTARAEAEQHAARADMSAREAERANQAKDEFLAVLSHELRTPLTPVLLSVSLMEMNPNLPDDLLEDLATIRRNVELESRLISDLLDITRISHGKIQLELRDLDLHAVIHSALAVCRRENTAALVTHFSTEPVRFRGDPDRLQQVVWNLLHNAQKFTPPTGLITLRTGVDERNVWLEVSDTGIGFDPELLTRLFNPFEQSDTGITRKHGGLGLGLAICRRLVELHGGTITARSVGLGRGATFCVALPRMVVEAADFVV